MGRYLKRRKRGWYFVMDIPAAYRPHFGGKARVEMTLSTRDETLAAAKAKRLAGDYKLRFLALDGNREAAAALLRDDYARARLQAHQGKIVASSNDPHEDPVELGVGFAIDSIVDRAPISPDPRDEGEPILTPNEEARIAGWMDGLAERQGRSPENRERFEPPFKELADRWLTGWKAAPDRRASNTGLQYAAAIRLFNDFWGTRSIRDIRQQDAAEFVELLRRLPPSHGRGKYVGVPLKEVVELAPDGAAGLSSSSIKRHLGVMKQVWDWAKPLGYCSGEHPFVVKLPKQRSKPYLGWQTGDLKRLFGDPPSRRDIYEAFFIAMFTGLRVNEIADITWGQVRSEQGVDYLQITDAKTEAGYRKVPLHSNLRWFLQKARGGDGDPVFPTFTPEGPAKARGGDASKLFGAWKMGLGVTPRRYVFHSARKNVTAVMEENSVPANVWARIIGHEPGFTYKIYNPHGLTLAKSREIIELISYPDVEMLIPSEIYGQLQKRPKSAGTASA